MFYYHVCPDCGANLDPDERCDCLDELIATVIPQKKKPRSKRCACSTARPERSSKKEALKACG